MGELNPTIRKILDKMKELDDRAEAWLINPKTVRYSILAALCVFLPAIFIGYLVAQLDPDGYNIFKNMISDLGSFNHTPVPLFLDWGAMITSFLLLPSTFYLEKLLNPIPEKAQEPIKFSRVRSRWGSLAFFWMLFGLVGFFGIGFFSEDRSNLLQGIGLPGLHGIFSVIVFGGISIAGIFFGLIIAIYPMDELKIPRLLGFYMMFGPPIMCFLFLYNVPPSPSFWEWMLMFSIFVWIIPVAFIVERKVRKEIPPKEAK